MQKAHLRFLVTHFVLLALVNVSSGQAICDFKPVASDTLTEKDAIALIKSVNQDVETYHRLMRKSRLLDVKIKALSKRLSWLQRDDVKRSPVSAIARLKTKLHKTRIESSNGIDAVNRYAIRNSVESKLLSVALISDQHERNLLYHNCERERLKTNANKNSRLVITDWQTFRRRVEAEVALKVASHMKGAHDPSLVDRIIGDLEKNESRLSYSLQALVIDMFVWHTPTPSNLDAVLRMERATKRELDRAVSERNRLSKKWNQEPLRSRANRGTHLAGQTPDQDARLKKYWSLIANQCKKESGSKVGKQEGRKPTLIADNFGIRFSIPHDPNSRTKIELRRGDGCEGILEPVPTPTRSYRILGSRKHPRFSRAIDLNGFVIMNFENQKLANIETVIDLDKLSSLSPDFKGSSDISLPELSEFIGLDQNSVRLSSGVYYLKR